VPSLRSVKTVLISLLIAAGLAGMLVFWVRRLASRFAGRHLAEALRVGRDLARVKRGLDPESHFVVHISEESVWCERPDGRIEGVNWSDLRRVEILTTSGGPFSPDIFWVLSGSETGCVIPWGATGDGVLLEHLQRLPRFNNAAVISASAKTEEGLTFCWQKIGRIW